MSNKSTKVLFVIILFRISIGCLKTKSTSSYSDVKVIKLTKYRSDITSKKDTLINPSVIRYNDNSWHLFIYDDGTHQVLRLNDNGNVVNRYGRVGRGPGEFLSVNNIFMTDHYLYVVDQTQYRISRFNINGNLDSTMNYGSKTPSHMPPPPPAALIPRAKDINNQPAVTLNGNILLPMAQTDKNKKLYKLVNWKKAHISDIGDVPIGSAFVITHDKYKAAIKNHEIPDFYKPSVFIVNDGAQPADYYIYNVISKIVKYNFSGRELWQTKIPRTPEVDSLTRTFYNQSEKLHGRSRIRLKKYVAGISSKDGHFYLALGKYGNSPKDLWIHAFNTKGKLIRRYKLVSKDVDLAAIFAIDSSGHRIFVATRKGKIRAYSF